MVRDIDAVQDMCAGASRAPLPDLIMQKETVPGPRPRPVTRPWVYALWGQYPMKPKLLAKHCIVSKPLFDGLSRHGVSHDLDPPDSRIASQSFRPSPAYTTLPTAARIDGLST